MNFQIFNFQKNKFQFLLLIIAVFIFGGCNIKQLQYFSPGQTVNKTTGQPAVSSAPETTTSISPSPSMGSQTVPLPSGQSIVRTFFTLINEKRIAEAVAMLSESANPDETTKQTWGVNFASIKSLTLKSVEPWEKNSWSEGREIYKVVLDIALEKGDFAYGWNSGENTRWVEVVKKPPTNIWQINQIATGP